MFKRIKRISSKEWYYYGWAMIWLGVIAIVANIAVSLFVSLFIGIVISIFTT